MVKVCPVTISNKGTINLYSAVAMSSAMYLAGANGIQCRAWSVYDHHPISYARNMAVSEFMKDKENTHLFFVDDDVVVPVPVITSLLKYKQLVTSGWYIGRGGTRQPVLFRRLKHGWENISVNELKNVTEQLIQVDGVGAGCLLIHRNVFEVLDTEEPFKEMYSMISGVKHQGEDLYFCNLLSKAGIAIYVDPALRCYHHHWTLL